MKTPDYAGQCTGESSKDNERIKPALEVDHEQQIDQRDCHQHSDAQPGET